MKIHTVIIDDELSGVRSLELMCSKFIEDVKIVATTTDAVEGVEIINSYRPDLVFLDINMPQLNGFELLEKLSFADFHLVFSTAYQQYALKALKLNASDYLLKPVGLADLKNTIGRIRQKMSEDRTMPGTLAIIQQFGKINKFRIPLPDKHGIEYALPSQVMYIEASSNNACVTLTSGSKETVIQSLKEYEALLCNPWLYFMRIHNSYIINLHYVARYLKENGGLVMMQDKTIIPISKSKKEEFFKSINLNMEN